jgi:hypothetical protein
MWVARQIGVFIRELRQARQISLGRLAGRTPDERAWLSDGDLFLAPPLDGRLVTLDALEHALKPLQRQIYAGEDAGIDLRCLTLASQLWPLTDRHRDARRLLSEVSATRSEWLRWQGRNRRRFSVPSGCKSWCDRMSLTAPSCGGC